MRIPILMYHHVAPAPVPAFEKYTVTSRAFDAQMRMLALLRYTPLTLDALLAARASGRPIPSRSVVITFDDGFQECIENAVPILKKYRMTAIFFLVAGLMGQRSEWLERERGVTLELADDNTARRLLADGFECGAHSLTHPHLTELTELDCRRELTESRSRLEKILGQEISHLAYPFGDWNGRVRTIAMESGYRSACAVEIGVSDASDSPFALRRVPITGFDTLPDFVCRLNTGWRWSEWLRGRFETLPGKRTGGARVA